MNPTATSKQSDLTWQRSLTEAIRDPDELFRVLELPKSELKAAREATTQFGLMVTRSYVARMTPGDLQDPLLLQVLPVAAEHARPAGFTADALEEHAAHAAPGLLQKYHGRALLIATGSCAIHCRYCFRREYPYQQEPRRIDEWEPALRTLAENPTISEAILSGGDPLMLTDTRLSDLLTQLESISHIRRLRIHTRLPVVLPNRVTPTLTDRLRASRLQTIFVVHANHANEIAADAREALVTLRESGFPVLNQAVLLRNVNDTADAQTALCERLIDIGVLPYYLHQLDRVQGTAHFETQRAVGQAIIAELRQRLPGYGVPRFVAEEPGAAHKTVIEFGDG